MAWAQAMGACTLQHKPPNLGDQDGTSWGPTCSHPQQLANASIVLHQCFFPGEVGATSSPVLQLLLGERRLCLQLPSGRFMVRCHPPMGEGPSPSCWGWAEL